MTNTEKIALECCAKRIKELASLENASFSFNDKEQDEAIKKAIKPYMMWFEIVANNINDIIELSDEKGLYKKRELEKIIRYNL